MPEPVSDEFYVGYIPKAPPGIAARTRAAVVAYVAMSMIVATVCVGFIARTGKGTWADASFQSFTGVLRVLPYPMIELDRPMFDGALRTALLVDFGKRGAQGRAAGYEDARVVVTGTVLERDGRCMIELAPEADAIREAKASGESRERNGSIAVPESPGTLVTLRGEIVDPKCFLGAMKPGEGKTHKACAVRCISGGIPPCLICWDDTGQATYYILTDEQGHATNNRFLDVVGEAVEIRGEVWLLGDMKMLRPVGDGVKRL